MTTTTIVKESIMVDAARAVVFDAYVNKIDAWWPRRGKYRYSFAPTDTEPGQIRFEARPGGRFYETFADGREYVIGHITSWEPPARLTYTWQAPDWAGETTVDVQFETVDGGTRVSVRHSGWEKAGALDVAAGYGVGLAEILGHFAAWVLAQEENEMAA